MAGLSLGRCLRAIVAEPVEWIDVVIRHLPGRIGRLARRLWFGQRLAALGEGASFAVGATVVDGRNIRIGHRFSMLTRSALYAHEGTLEIGDGVSVNTNVCIDASDCGRIVIGKDVLIGQNVVVQASNHAFGRKDKPINQQGHTGGNIVIQDDVWIAANAVILPNVTIGSHAIIGAGAVVTQDVESWTIVGGVPARVISRR